MKNHPRAMNTKHWQPIVHALAVEKGWWDEPRSVEECLMLVITELAEAAEEYRSGRSLGEVRYECSGVPLLSEVNAMMEPGSSCMACRKPITKPVGFGIELADVAIRLMDLAGRLKMSIQIHEGRVVRVDRPLLANLLGLVWLVADVRSERDFGSAMTHLVDFADRYGIDLEEMVRIKHEHNKTRPHRHGKLA